MSLYRILLFAVSAGTFYGCHDSVLKPEAYKEWVEDEDNGIHIKKTISDYTFNLQYKPYEYLAIERSKKFSISKKELAEYENETGGLHYYTFKIESDNPKEPDVLKKGIQSEAEYYDRLQYFSSMMQEDLKLIEGEDTLDCVLFHFETNYGITPYCNFALAFEGSGQNKVSVRNNMQVSDRVFVFNDRVLSVGKINLKIKARDLERIPQLKTF